MMEERITSRKNPYLQQVRKLLSSRKEREKVGLFVADGTKLLQMIPALIWMFLKRSGLTFVNCIPMLLLLSVSQELG